MTRPPLGIDDKLWLEYITIIEKHNEYNLEDHRQHYKNREEERKIRVDKYNSLPKWRKFFATYPRQDFCPTFLDPFIISPSLEGFLTWKAKGKKL